MSYTGCSVRVPKVWISFVQIYDIFNLYTPPNKSTIRNSLYLIETSMFGLRWCSGTKIVSLMVHLIF